MTAIDLRSLVRRHNRTQRARTLLAPTGLLLAGLVCVLLASLGTIAAHHRNAPALRTAGLIAAGAYAAAVVGDATRRVGLDTPTNLQTPLLPVALPASMLAEGWRASGSLVTLSDTDHREAQAVLRKLHRVAAAQGHDHWTDVHDLGGYRPAVTGPIRLGLLDARTIDHHVEVRLDTPATDPPDNTPGVNDHTAETVLTT